MTLAPRHVLLSRGYRLGGRYELSYPCAQGGMATVWLARVRGQHGFEKLFAVKTILPHLAKDAAFRTMFLDEARIASRIRHGNVAEIATLGEDAGVLFMAIEWVQGDPWSKLTAAIRASGDPMPLNVMLRIAAGACAGLHAAHELRDEAGKLLNVVHRDVSPQNVLVTEGGTVKVIDFGVAKAADRAAEQTRAGLLKGKLEYMAPEQAAERPVDRRADIWAMGAVLYEVIAGHPPHMAESDLLAVEKSASGDPPEPLPSDTAPDVMTLVERALESHRERRFDTALDMQRAIEACITTPVTPEDVSACVHRYLGPSIATRRQSIGDALGGPQEPSQADASQDLFDVDVEEEAAEGHAATGDGALAQDSRSIDTSMVLQRAHKIWLIAATLLTIAVWSHALVALAHAISTRSVERAAP